MPKGRRGLVAAACPSIGGWGVGLEAYRKARRNTEGLLIEQVGDVICS